MLERYANAVDFVASLPLHPRSYTLHPGHSLGAGTAILLKILLEQQTKAAGQEGGPAGSGPSARLDAGRPVHMECYAFAPPPVFSGPDAVGMPNVYSFVNG